MANSKEALTRVDWIKVRFKVTDGKVEEFTVNAPALLRVLATNDVRLVRGLGQAAQLRVDGRHVTFGIDY